MKTRSTLLLITCLLAALPTLAGSLPNIVLVMADDVGPGDIGFYHRERTGEKELFPTPNIDRLIAEGIRFEDAHSAAPLCAPSRFGMLTGSYSYRNYQKFGVWEPWAKTGVDPKFTTSGRIAQQAGYATAFFGKSGMGGSFKVTQPDKKFSWKDRYKKFDLSNRTVGPNQLGFDYSFELPSGIQGPPLAYYENEKWVPLKPDSTFTIISPKQSMYDISRKHNEIEIIGDSNWDPTLAGPMLANKAVEYINRQIESDPEQPFFMYYCTQAVHIPHTPPEEIDGVKIAGTTTGPHGDLIRELDVQVGMLIRALKAAGVYDDTLFIFTSDNGGLAADPEAERLGHDPTNGLAQLKGSIMEGGHRVPFIARWPGKIAPGTRSMEVINALDVVATIAALTGQEICRDQVMDSINLMPLLTKQSDAKGHAVLVHHSQFGKVALRQGDWKLVAEHEKLKNLKPINLFNLKTNPKEKKSLDYLNNPESRERIEQMMKTLKYCLDNPTVDLQ